MTTLQAKKFLEYELAKHLGEHPLIPCSIEQLLNDRLSPLLDESVHDLASEFAAANHSNEREADIIDINNAGLDSQLAFLCAHWKEDRIRSALMKALKKAINPEEFSAE